MSTAVHSPADPALSYACAVCERPLEPVEFSDGGRWSICGLAMHGRRRFKSVLCWNHYLAACRAAIRERRN